MPQLESELLHCYNIVNYISFVQKIGRGAGMADVKFFEGNEQTLENIFNFVANFEEGLILFDMSQNELKYINNAAQRMLGIEDNNKIWETLTKEESEKLRADGYLTKYINGQTIRLSIIETGNDDIWIRLAGEDEMKRLERGIDKTRELNRNIRKLLMKYDQSSLMIANGEGVIFFTGEETVENCGYDKNWYLGKSVYELEKQQVFYPSVIKKVIETGQEQVVMQKTKMSDKLLVAIGVPVFDEAGNMERVLSITKDYTDQIELSGIIAQMEFCMDITNGSDDVLDNIITCDEKMLEIKSLVKVIAPTDSTVLILGNTGTGKEVLANAIHRLSNRADKPFIVVSCGSLSPNIVESELFGYESGAFTGASREGHMGLLEAANGGTVFLDEIGELPMGQQVKLLHVLQEKSIVRVGGTKQIPLDIRVIAATNRDLREQIAAGQFREDLYYRLNVVSIVIPKLSERRGDIPILVKYFTDKFNKKHNKNKVIAKNVIDLLCRCEWQGNIRELENSIENLIVTSPYNYIDMEDIPDSIAKADMVQHCNVEVKAIAPLPETIEEVERQLLVMAKKKYGTTYEIAEALGVNQSTISRKLHNYGIR